MARNEKKQTLSTNKRYNDRYDSIITKLMYYVNDVLDIVDMINIDI